jgi:hypothetical protein
MTVNRQDLAVGAIFVAIALFFGIDTLIELPIGTPRRMGPGFFPVVLSGLLLIMGVAIALKGLRSQPMTLGPVPWRGLAVLLPVPVVFGLTIRGLGLTLSIFLVAFISTFASRRATLVLALALGVGLTIFCVLVFHYGLGVPTPLFGSWVMRFFP